MSFSRKNKESNVPLVRIVSLGCPKNFVDTEQAAADLVMHGFGLAASDEEASVVFINTCAFLQSAREESSRAIREALRWKTKRPDRFVVVAGCAVNWDKTGAFRKEFPDVDAWLPVSSVSRLGAALKAVTAGGALSPFHPEPDPARLPLTPSHYAWLRIADGCDNRCSYCLIPDIRGPLRSRKEEDILREAASLLESGVRELLVIAQDSSAYGRDLDGRSHLAGLLKKLDALPGGDYRIRLLYLHPASLSAELMDAMDSAAHLIRCIEMPIQHIADAVLKRMNRHISEPELRNVISELRKRGYAIRTTLMTGFPGETEEDFSRLLDFVREIRFERLGVFAWSAEPGTPAAGMTSGMVPEPERIRRRDLLMKAQKAISLAANRKAAGKTMEIIVDRVSPDGTGTGRSLLDIPEIDNTVVLNGLSPRIRPGDRIRCLVGLSGAYDLTAEPVRTVNKSKTKEKIKP